MSDLSEVFAVKEETHGQIIEEIFGRWTFVEADGIQGWVSGGFLSRNPLLKFKITLVEPPTGVYPTHIEAIEYRRWLVFSDGNREGITNVATWYALENTMVFSTNSKESEYELLTRGGIFAFSEIDQIEDWFFLGNLGFVYLYDLPTDGKDTTEHRLLQQFPKFKRYGPLLQVDHNNTIIKLWDTGVEITSNWLRLVDYYEEHEEILLEHIGYESVSFRIYNLRLETHTDYYGGLPYFNSSRDATISAYADDSIAFISVYTIDNGMYTNVFAETIEGIRQTGEKRWINDDEFRLELVNYEDVERVFLIKRNGASFELLQEQ